MLLGGSIPDDATAAVVGGLVVGIFHVARGLSALAQRVSRLEGRADRERDRGCK